MSNKIIALLFASALALPLAVQAQQPGMGGGIMPPPNNMQQNRMPPNQMPPNQMQQNNIPPNQMMQNGMQPDQMQQGQGMMQGKPCHGPNPRLKGELRQVMNNVNGLGGMTDDAALKQKIQHISNQLAVILENMPEPNKDGGMQNNNNMMQRPAPGGAGNGMNGMNGNMPPMPQNGGASETIPPALETPAEQN